LNHPLPLAGGRVREGVEALVYPLFYPHPSLPPASGKEQKVIFLSFDVIYFSEE
jgi:hypothetical protein